YGTGEGANSADFVTPTPTPNPSLGVVPANLVPAQASLPDGAVDAGIWSELGGTATKAGLSGDAGLSIEPSLSAGPNNTLYAAWADSRSGNFEIYVAQFSQGAWIELGGSASEGAVSRTLSSSRRPSMTVDASGAPVVAWTEFSGTQHDIVAAR